MSHETIGRLFEIVDGARWDELREAFCEDAVYERPGYPPFVGIAEVLRFYQTVRVIASGRHRLESVVSDGASGACWGQFEGVLKDDSQVSERFADVYTFEGGRIKRRRSFFFRPAI